MNVSEISALKQIIDPKIEKGDYITLGKMLNVPQGTARMQYHRDSEEAVTAMKKIVEAREDLITSHQQQ
ncbi:MAG: hypothetical protein JJE55_08040 [Flavobacteriaceae bacterium]|nr:hypothetical protein [Flavobacteriaceae bacterium]